MPPAVFILEIITENVPQFNARRAIREKGTASWGMNSSVPCSAAAGAVRQQMGRLRGGAPGLVLWRRDPFELCRAVRIRFLPDGAVFL